MHTDALNTDPDPCPPEVKPRPMKTIYKIVCTCMCGKNLLQNPSYQEQNDEGKMKAYLGGVLLFLYIVTNIEGMCSSI